MARQSNTPETINLRNYVEGGDMDTLVYVLVNAAVEKRNAVDEEIKQGGGNKAEAKYWQRVVEILSNTQSELEAL